MKTPIASGIRGGVFGASGVGSVTLLKYNKYFPHVVVHKMNPEVGLDSRLPLTTLYQSQMSSIISRK